MVGHGVAKANKHNYFQPVVTQYCSVSSVT